MSDKLCLALDVESREKALGLVRLLDGVVGLFKVGSQLFTSEGPGLVREIQQLGGRVFLDLKFHDIPNTVAGAAKAAGRLGVFMLDVHASGGLRMLRAAVEACAEGAEVVGMEAPRVVGITVLTSLSVEELNRELKVSNSIEEHVSHLARLCQEAGLAGVVASPQELAVIRKACGPDFTIVTPGIRPASAKTKDDQVRITTPKQAIADGADYIVVGRPILAAEDPLEAASKIVDEMV